jgi:formamidopyrimidine-DNA glycosylase
MYDVPELPDVELYVAALRARVVGSALTRLRIANPFVLRSVDPPISEAEGRRVTGVSRLGKRIVIALEDERYIVIHLMIAGRLRWRASGTKVPKKRGLAAFEFPAGQLLFTEEGSQRRAAIWFVHGAAALAAHDPGGIEPLTATLASFTAALTRERHTLKRTLTDPHIFAGIGNAYSDEILHAAQLSPLQLSTNLDAAETERLFKATQRTLTEWTERLRAELAGAFPEKVTAFREGMAVHGRYKLPCPVCASPVQRIRYAENEVNYCARCQTGGRVLADRALSRLLKEDWPRSLDDWGERLGNH